MPQDLSTRRNAFHMLAEHAQDKAVAYLFQQIDRVADWGDILQIAVLDLIRKVRGAGQGAGAACRCSLSPLLCRAFWNLGYQARVLSAVECEAASAGAQRGMQLCMLFSCCACSG